MWTRGAIAGAVFGLNCGCAGAETPLSAIDWLSESIETTAMTLPVLPREEAVSQGVGTEVITVTPLEAVSADSVGLLPASVTGLPIGLWGRTPSAELAGLFGRLDTGLLPAMRELVFTLLLAELNPPADSDATGQLFLARIDTLLGLGAVEQAQALLERAGTDAPERFRRWFDASLLTGTEDAACEKLRAAPGLAPTFPARIFCLARGGDWNAAALTLQTGRALGAITEAEDALLARFLDPDLAEGAAPLPRPSRPSPLVYRLYEAIGQPLPTTTLPLAFAQADLRANTGWKPRIEAAERLARSGAAPGNLLLGLYTERKPAASGGVWDRAAAIRRLDGALEAGKAEAVAASLPAAWDAMHQMQLETVFAGIYADKLAAHALSGPAAALAFRIALLTGNYETAAAGRAPADAEERFLKAVARGDLAGTVAPDEFAQAIADGFRATTAPQPLARLVAGGELGAAILQAVAMAGEGALGDLGELTEAIAFFRAIGLEDVARRVALQVMILDPRG
ncbi:MAG: hypothetical protein GY717_12975 [Rhodobacteraceae bacterium]|nr:hypothetical protein [Paracoccaceae bacterium]